MGFGDWNVSEALATGNVVTVPRTFGPRGPAYEDVFLPFARAREDRPFVVAQLGQSLDGRIATITGESQWINQTPALNHLHRLRALVDAVVVGIGTAEADDPSLTVRRVPGRNPARVVIDPHGRLSKTARCLADDGCERVVIGPKRGDLPAGVASLSLAPAGRRFCPNAIAHCLFAQGYKRILVEGGACTVSRFIEAAAVDRLHLLVAPVILGSGKPGLDLSPIHSLDDAIRPPVQAYPLDDGEVLFDCDLRGGCDVRGAAAE